MIVGFIGTRHGMTTPQALALRGLLIDLRPEWLHLEDCIGAGEQAHSIAGELHIRVHMHPPDNPIWRAWCPCPVQSEPASSEARTRAIVSCSDLVICAARGLSERDSRVLAAIRRARRAGKSVAVIDWTGSVDHTEEQQ